MKVFFNGKQVLELQEWQKKVIKNDIPSAQFDADMTRRCKYWLEIPAKKHAHQHQAKMMKSLRDNGVKSIPVDLVKLGEKFQEMQPMRRGFKGISGPIQCQVGDQPFELSESHRKVLRGMKDIQESPLTDEEFIAEEEKELGESMAWILKHKFERCFERLLAEWRPKLASRGYSEIPADPEEFANLVFSQPDYKDREARDADELARR